MSRSLQTRSPLTLSQLAAPLALLPLVAVTGCASPPPGSASAVVTYVDESGEQQRVEVAVDSAQCDTEDPRRLGTADETIVMLVGSAGDTTMRVHLGDDLSFLAQTTASATRTGLEVADVPGTIVRSGISGTQTRISSDATLSAKVVCPG